MAQFTVISHTKEKCDNLVYASFTQSNIQTFSLEGSFYGQINGEFGRNLIVKVELTSDVKNGNLLLTKSHMEFLGLTEEQKLTLQPVTRAFLMASVATSMSFRAYNPDFEKSGCAYDIEHASELKFGRGLNRAVRTSLKYQLLFKGQKALLKYKRKKIMVFVEEAIVGNPGESSRFGRIGRDTNVIVSKFARNECFRPGVDPDNLAKELERRLIGGMDYVIGDLMETIFKYKFLPADIQNGLNLDPVKGVLFYGPPGTGKTLIARNFCDIILSVKPKIINGPSLMDPYIGTSEKNVRDLFTPAYNDYKSFGNSSPLHVLIFDEFDSVAPKRGSGSDKSPMDAVTNQLLTMLDGIEQIPNILVLATTNRIDLLDPAVLRSGRIEKCVYVDYPTQAERINILNLNLTSFRSKNLIDDDVNIEEIARLSKGLSGADIGTLVTNSFKRTLKGKPYAMMRRINETEGGLTKANMSHFRAVLGEMQKSPVEQRREEPSEEGGQPSYQPNVEALEIQEEGEPSEKAGPSK